MTDIKDFTRKRSRILFRIDDDLFEASPALPAETLYEFSLRFSDLDKTEDRLSALVEVLEMTLLPESCTIFRTRLKDPERPIELDQLNDVLVWLLEQYGARPTMLSSSSSPGLPGQGSGTSSMDVVQPVGSISAPSQPIAS